MNAQMNPNGSLGWFQERTNTETESEAVAWSLWVSSITNCGQRAAVRIWAAGDRFCSGFLLCIVRKIRLDSGNWHLTKLLPSLFVAATLSLSACGGGGEGEGRGGIATAPPVGLAPVAPVAPTPPALPEVSDVLPSCTNCGAVNSTTYSGSGIGIWHKTNLNAGTSNVAVSIGGLVNKSVTLVVTNQTPVVQALPLLQPHTDYMEPPTGPAPVEDPVATLAATPKVHRNAVVALPAATQMRNFAVKDGTTRTTTLMQQYTLADGALVSLWVENSQLGTTKMTPAITSALGATFAGAGGVYDMLKTVGGPLWGPHTYTNYMGWSSINIDLVFVGLGTPGSAYGEVGYFHARNIAFKSADPASNESLALFLDADTTYGDGERGLRTMKTVMAHEGLHMSNFYRRSLLVGLGHQYQPWLEELTAMMVEDAFASTLGTAYNPTRDSRVPYYFPASAYACAVTDFVCGGYPLVGSFGGFLMRQLGMPFLKALLNNPVAGSEAALDAAIKVVRPSSSLGDEMRKFTVSMVALLPAVAPPAGFGFPGVSSAELTLVGFDTQTLDPNRWMPAVAPTALNAYASFPVSRARVTGIFRETVSVPAGATLSVVVNY